MVEEICFIWGVFSITANAVGGGGGPRDTWEVVLGCILQLTSVSPGYLSLCNLWMYQLSLQGPVITLHKALQKLCKLLQKVALHKSLVPHLYDPQSSMDPP